MEIFPPFAMYAISVPKLQLKDKGKKRNCEDVWYMIRKWKHSKSYLFPESSKNCKWNNVWHFPKQFALSAWPRFKTELSPWTQIPGFANGSIFKIKVHVYRWNIESLVLGVCGEWVNKTTCTQESQFETCIRFCFFEIINFCTYSAL